MTKKLKDWTNFLGSKWDANKEETAEMDSRIVVHWNAAADGDDDDDEWDNADEKSCSYDTNKDGEESRAVLD